MHALVRSNVAVTHRAGLSAAPRPRPRAALSGTGTSVDPARALAWLEDLRSLWEVELPEAPEHGATRREYKLRRAEATASAFDRVEALGPVIVEAKVADDLLIGRSLVLALAPERAELTGEKAAVMEQLIGGALSAHSVRHDRGTQEAAPAVPRGDIKVHWSGREG